MNGNESDARGTDTPIERRSLLKLLSAGAVYPFVQTGAAATNEVVLDNPDATTSGTWTSSTFRSGYYGSDYIYANDGSGGSTARYTPDLPADGEYEIYVQVPEGNEDSGTRAPYTVSHSEESQTIDFDQNVSGGQWYQLSSSAFPFAAGTNGYVEVSNDDVGAKYVFADGIKFVQRAVTLDNPDATTSGTWTSSTFRSGYYGSDYIYANDGSGGSTARYTPDLPADGEYEIYVQVPEGNEDSGTRAPYTVSYDGGTQTVDFDQNVKGSQWHRLGSSSFTFTSGTNGYVEVSNDDVGAKYVFADGVKFEKVVPAEIPRGLTVQADDGRTYLEWDNVAGVTYNLKRATSSEGPYQTIASNISNPLGIGDAPASMYYVDEGVSNGTTYYYTVSANTSTDESGNASEASATPTQAPPRASPKALRARSRDGAVDLSWRSVSGATSYEVHRSTTSGGSYSQIDTTSSTIYTDTGVSNGTTYHYVVYPVNGAGMGSLSSFQANAAPRTTADLLYDDGDATLSGTWDTSEYNPGFFGQGYRTANSGSGGATARWEPTLSSQGDYSVWVYLPHGSSSYASAAPYAIDHANGSDTVRVDIRGAQEDWQQLGSSTYTFSPGSGHGVELSNDADGYVVADAIRFVPASETPNVEFGVDWDDPRQHIEGMGCEIQFDCIGANNDMSSCTDERVPEALSDSEAQRWYSEMLSNFRHVRLAMGLYLRGTDSQERLLEGRYAGQIADIAETVQQSGTKVMPTYWSPTPYFKSSDDYLYEGLESTSTTALADMADAMVTDMQMLDQNGIDASIWSLQNEPHVKGGGYSKCGYGNGEYADALHVVGQRIRSEFPSVRIHGPDHNTGSVPSDGLSDAVRSNPEALELIDMWSWHALTSSGNPDSFVGTSSLGDEALGRPVINTEFEYLGGNTNFTHTAKMVMNHFVYMDSPTFFWLHALKPTTVANDESGYGYSLGWFRPPSDSDSSDDGIDVDVGEWTYNDVNWNGIVPFVELIPHDSVRYSVLGDDADDTTRVAMAWEAPNGDRGLALLNDSGSTKSFDIDLGGSMTLSGQSFSESERFTDLGSMTTSTLSVDVDPHTLEVWTE
ncbi:golvesin C-terminal-like domain-containing protein [Halococcus agarilyticus]|uniref:golvesin C-terminal-like domain-containing protein n=1 Tax=Halococcus agarilyticus TaxID=1232219 RepID=UPI00067766D6|nr:hypothetical protein [Halococcus agarilyticus]